MANPQKEKGYLKIANELADAFCGLKLSDQEWRVLWTILRFSYGWNKKRAYLTLKQISIMTGIDIRHLSAVLKKLLDKRVIERDGKYYWLQKDYEKWISLVHVSHKWVSPEQVKKVTQTGEQNSHGQVNENAENPLTDSELQTPKDSIKDNYKDISLRERIFLKLKNYFPKLIVPDHVPAERMDYFLFLIETKGIKPDRIDSPVAYMMSKKLFIESFPSLSDREEEARIRKEEELEKRRLEKEARKRKSISRESLADDEELVELVSTLHKKLGIKSEYTRI